MANKPTSGFAEVIYETGALSIVSYESLDELQNGLAEHHRRAVNGEPGASQDQVERTDLNPGDFDRIPSLDTMKSRPAERVKRVFLYDQHPADFAPVGNEGEVEVDGKVLSELVKGMTNKDGFVNMQQLIEALRDEASPVYPVKQGKFESFYKQPETSELDLGFLKEVEG